jgi:hypothetical protein
MTKPGLMRTFAIGSTLAVLLGACGILGVSGSGPTKSEVRTVDTFSRIESSNGIGVTIHVGGAQAVEVTAQENILPLVGTTVAGDVLTIKSTQSYSTSVGVAVTITVPGLDGITVSGGSQAHIDGLAAGLFAVTASGGGGVSATGSATTVTIAASGGASLELGSLLAKTITVDLSGGATGALHASAQVSGSASGGATATVTGGAKLNVDASGGASFTSK